jgi:dTDP-4-dehydrorhamnose 3,5-epimerase
LQIIHVPDGNVMHAITNSSPGFNGFGEAYFSTILWNRVKSWRRHRAMTMNLTVPHGKVRFVMYDDRANSNTRGMISDLEISLENYVRLTVAPGIWVAFQGLAKDSSLILNFADIPHDPKEAEQRPLEEIPFDWSRI